MLENPHFKERVQLSKREREAQKKYRDKHDPEHDYDNLDDWLMGTNNGT